MSGFIVSGTDTNIGKTVFSAALAGALQAHYWKPIQSGLEGETDSEIVGRLSGLPRQQRLAMALFYVEGLSVAEVASALEISDGAVRFHLHQGRARLRGLVEDQKETPR